MIHNSKKSQSEIVGITIVMVLIMLGIIFVIRYVVLPNDYNVKQAFDKTQTAANFMDTLLKTSTHCNSLSITKLIQDCFENYDTSFLYSCPPDTTNNICIGGCTSCEFLNQSLSIILNKTLNTMPQIKYDFYICRWDSANGVCYDLFPSDIISKYIHDDCLNYTRHPNGYEAKQQPIPTDIGNRRAQIYVC